MLGYQWYWIQVQWQQITPETILIMIPAHFYWGLIRHMSYRRCSSQHLHTFPHLIFTIIPMRKIRLLTPLNRWWNWGFWRSCKLLSVTREVVKLRLNPEQFDPKTCRSNLKCNPASDTQHPKTFYLNFQWSASFFYRWGNRSFKK